MALARIAMTEGMKGPFLSEFHYKTYLYCLENNITNLKVFALYMYIQPRIQNCANTQEQHR